MKESFLIELVIESRYYSGILYTLVDCSGNIDYPIMLDDYIIFFMDINLANHALRVSTNMDGFKPAPTDISLTCDVPYTLKLIKYHDVDDSSVILNCINTLLDFLYAMHISIPDEYRSVLYKVSDFLTFNLRYSEFFLEQSVDRGYLCKVISWCVDTTIFSSLLFQITALGVDRSKLNNENNK